MSISERQKEIIDAAGKILTQSGISGLTTKNLAKEMGFSEAAIYRHFPSKEAIILAMLGFLRSNMDSRISEVNQSLGVEERFRAIFSSQFSFFTQNQHFVVAVFSDGLWEESGQVNQAILALMQTKMRFLLPLIQEGQSQGLFKSSISSEQITHIVMGAFRLHMFKWRVSGFSFDLVSSGHELIDSILEVIKK
ncbi:MAG: TetR/AcrR family transcriptional regulator [Algoriphagus sp.]|uniref:TetR/AcrR family transcriptional regulator n=1 Tax=Algoriphagus sp. TaxID=1872435 RepID=UPI002730EF79|nr:TetR/AcrR family transcriptional regulator [Algoriphagus sp.]MDP2043514.1 TetR/AcrR family transcriptional regulator [Algoriphagus sp.]MDP3472446.1 TetR/AcrR family transcriptional regulator [Algoriphagus sp.]